MFKIFVVVGDQFDKELFKVVVWMLLWIKVYEEFVDKFIEIVVNVVFCVQKLDEVIDLFMVEIMYMRYKFDIDICFVEGFVLDYGVCYFDMKK